MSCEPIRMKDGTVVLANVKTGQKLTEQDKQVLAEWVEDCRTRKAARESQEQRARNRKGAAE